MNLKKSFIILLIASGITLIGNFIGIKVNPIEALPGIMILLTFAMIGIALSNFLPIKIPAVAYIVVISTVFTIPGVPFAEEIYKYTSKVNFLALCTPILAYAGIYTGKNLDGLRKSGWKIVLVSGVVMFGTFIGSAIIAHLVLKLLKII